MGTGSGPLIRIVKASFLGDKIMFEKYSVVHWGQEGKMKEGHLNRTVKPLFFFLKWDFLHSEILGGAKPPD